ASDLRHCNDIAKNMIKRYGLSKKFRNMVFGDENEEVFLGYSMGQVQSYSEQTAAAIDQEIKLIIDSCYEETKRILNEKRSVMEALAARLQDKLTVDGPEFELIYDSNGDLELADYAKKNKLTIDESIENRAVTAVSSIEDLIPPMSGDEKTSDDKNGEDSKNS
ncbi:MAG: hypothetical protein J5657_05155, partial [Clostridiales bacterium]|nr:hypothetical protein [Clostridiales bacterium]